MEPLKVGTRGSRLAMAQTNEVIEILRREGVKAETIVIRTKGDLNLRDPLYKIEEKGIFEKEINAALLRGDIDLAVHSLKDCTTELEEELALVVPRRKSPFDALVGCHPQELRPGDVIGTSSLRRGSHLLFLRPDIKVRPIRGNVDTRLEKVRRGHYRAVILAEAGLLRLGVGTKYHRFDVLEITPPAAQGALGVIARKEDKRTLELLSCVEDKKSRAEIDIEREILRGIGAGCRTPVGINASISGDKVRVIVSLVSPDLRRRVLLNCISSLDEISVEDIIDRFLSSGGESLIGEWRSLGKGLPSWSGSW